MTQSMTQSYRALIMAGGTGGHIFPGLAVAEKLQFNGWQISWLGSCGGMEESLVRLKDIEIDLINVKGLRGNGLFGWLKAPLNLTKAVFQAKRVLRERSPSIVIGFGGFASGPGGIAAFLAGKPLIIHEQNAIAGITNRCLSILATQVFQAFPNTFKATNKKLKNKKSQNKIRTVGNPVRKEILQLHKSNTHQVSEKVIGKVNILVIGGSRGALTFNRDLPKVFAQIFSQQKINIRHQTGKNRLAETKSFYAQANLVNQSSIELCEFMHDMASEFEWADIVIARAGASTVAEIAVVGVAAIFIPFPFAVDDHQAKNALWLTQANAALSFREEQITQAEFMQSLLNLINNKNMRACMANKAQAIAYVNATEEIVDLCDQLVRNAA